MKKLRVAFSLLMAFAQVLPTPLWAQAPLTVVDKDTFGSHLPSPDVCKRLQMERISLTMNPPAEWRGKSVLMYANIRQDGGVEDVKLVDSSGSASLDAAAMDHIRQTARWGPLRCGRTGSRGETVSVGIPSASCLVRTGWQPALPLTLAQPRSGVSASVQVSVAPDGRLADVSLYRRSGDAALDEALLAHVRATWRFYPMAEGCDTVTERFFIRFPTAACIPKPLVESRTLPPVVRPAGPRAVSLQVGVGRDGKVVFTHVFQSSGDAGLDAAAAAHVKEAWRWAPVTCPRLQPVSADTALPMLDTVQVAFP